jgi:hypothetical protein
MRFTPCAHWMIRNPARAERPFLEDVALTYVVTENCIKCKYTDCVEVGPVDCFPVGPIFRAIEPD